MCSGVEGEINNQIMYVITHRMLTYKVSKMSKRVLKVTLKILYMEHVHDGFN
jgi:hypothetical protein